MSKEVCLQEENGSRGILKERSYNSNERKGRRVGVERGGSGGAGKEGCSVPTLHTDMFLSL
jgi:hypothetical protein